MKELILKVEDLVGQTNYSIIGKDRPYHFDLFSGEVGILFCESESSELGRLLFGQGLVKSGSLNYHSTLGYQIERSNWKKNIGFAFREKGLISNLSLYDNVNLPVAYYNKEKDLSSLALREVEIEESLWNKRPHEVSQSILKRALFARSVVLKPKLLFLDDPTALLTTPGKKFFYHWLEKQKKKDIAILIATDEIYHASIWGDWYLCPKEHKRKNHFNEILSPAQIEIQGALKSEMEKKDFFDEFTSI